MYSSEFSQSRASFGIYEIPLPGACAIDSTKITAGGTLAASSVGHEWMWYNPTSATYPVEVIANGATAYVNLLITTAGSSFVTSSFPVSWGNASDQIGVHFTVPVSGWTISTPSSTTC